jgi:hypothetical protein
VRRRPLLTGIVGSIVVLLLFDAQSLAASHLPYGPGPKAHYTVQTQPPAGHCHYRHTKSHQPLPDRRCTPGALNPKVTQRTLAATICRSGYTTSIRPPESITEPEKIANARSYRYRASLAVAEYDHLVPLELGGDPNDARNLWVEPPSPGHKASQGVYNPKDKIENQARALVCAHKVSLTAMQDAIAGNWTTALAVVSRSTGPPKTGGPLKCSARVSNAHPSRYTTVVISIATKGNAAVTSTAHYRTKDTVKSTTANTAGSASISYYISGATKGYTVVVGVRVSLRGSNSSCSTQFTPT